MIEETPMIRQYKHLKCEAPLGSLLLFRLGDFFEAFGDDAVRLSAAFDVPCGLRGGVSMAGCLCDSFWELARRLTASGIVFVIAEEMESRAGSRLPRREIVRTVKGGPIE